MLPLQPPSTYLKKCNGKRDWHFFSLNDVRNASCKILTNLPFTEICEMTGEGIDTPSCDSRGTYLKSSPTIGFKQAYSFSKAFHVPSAFTFDAVSDNQDGVICNFNFFFLIYFAFFNFIACVYLPLFLVWRRCYLELAFVPNRNLNWIDLNCKETPHFRSAGLIQLASFFGQFMTLDVLKGVQNAPDWIRTLPC